MVKANRPHQTTNKPNRQGPTQRLNLFIHLIQSLRKQQLLPEANRTQQLKTECNLVSTVKTENVVNIASALTASSPKTHMIILSERINIRTYRITHIGSPSRTSEVRTAPKLQPDFKRVKISITKRPAIMRVRSRVNVLRV